LEARHEYRLPLAGSPVDEIGLHILCGQPHDLAWTCSGLVQNIDQQAGLKDDVADSRFLAADGLESSFPWPTRYALVVFGCEVQCGFDALFVRSIVAGLSPFAARWSRNSVRSSDSDDAVRSLLAGLVPARCDSTQDAFPGSLPRVSGSVLSCSTRALMLRSLVGV
jgi:hypothetical protein